MIFTSCKVNVYKQSFSLSLFIVSRIVRVIGKPRGNMLLIGIGGSGRQSLTRLAAYLIGYKVFQIEVTRNYKKAEFRDGMNLSQEH